MGSANISVYYDYSAFVAFALGIMFVFNLTLVISQGDYHITETITDNTNLWLTLFNFLEVFACNWELKLTLLNY